MLDLKWPLCGSFIMSHNVIYKPVNMTPGFVEKFKKTNIYNIKCLLASVEVLVGRLCCQCTEPGCFPSLPVFMLSKATAGCSRIYITHWQIGIELLNSWWECKQQQQTVELQLSFKNQKGLKELYIDRFTCFSQWEISEKPDCTLYQFKDCVHCCISYYMLNIQCKLLNVTEV